MSAAAIEFVAAPVCRKVGYRSRRKARRQARRHPYGDLCQPCARGLLFRVYVCDRLWPGERRHYHLGHSWRGGVVS